MNSLIQSALNRASTEEKKEKKARNNKDTLAEDEEARKFIQEIKIKVIGSGGAGNNTINRLAEMELDHIDYIAMNTDAQDLLYTKTPNKLLLGKETTKGLGAGSNPDVGEQAAEESISQIKKLIGDSDINILTCGLGGGTGTGSIPLVAKESKESGALTIAVVTFPFKLEGRRRIQNAIRGLENLTNKVDTLLVIPNEKLLEIAPNVPIQTAFKISDEIISNAISGIIELVKKEGLVNLDVADVKAVLKNSGYAMIGIGEADGKNRAEDAMINAIKNPLLDIDIHGATRALINVVGPSDLTLTEVSGVITKIQEDLDPDANIIWGAIIDENIEKKVKIMVMISGIRDDLRDKYYDEYLDGKTTRKEIKKEEREEQFEIEFID